MKYLCLLYIDESLLDGPQADVADPPGGASDAFTSLLDSRGCLVAGERLQPSGSTTTLRPRAGGVAIIDGPAAPAREQLASFHLIQARDLNEAIRIASGIPAARHGCVEVRPVRAPTPPPANEMR